MNKKIIVIIIVCVILLISGTIILDTNEEITEKNEIKQSEIIQEEFKFIFNISETEEEWLEYTTEEGITNKEIYERERKKVIGSTDGKLAINPIGFDEYINIVEDSSTQIFEYYKLTVQNNDFLIPQQISLIIKQANGEYNNLIFYILGNDMYFYKISLNIEKIPQEITLDENKWNTIISEENDYINIDSYYKINTNYCLHITYPNMTEKNSEKIEKDILEELAKQITNIISIEKVQDLTTIRYLCIVTESENIILDENTTILMKNLKIRYWNSGAEEIVQEAQIGSSSVLALNSKEQPIQIVEYDANIDIEAFYELFLWTKEKYNYKGRTIYITKYENKNNNTKSYVGIMFEANGRYYQVINYKEITQEEVNDIDEWIDEMIDGVIEIK